MNAPIEQASLKHRSRAEQHEVFKELRRSSRHVRRVNLAYNLIQMAVYFVLIFFIGLPLLDRLSTVAFVIYFVAATMLTSELLWRMFVLPAVFSRRK